MSFFRLWLIVLVMMACVEAQAHARGAPNFAPGRYLCADNGPILGNNSYSDAAHPTGNTFARYSSGILPNGSLPGRRRFPSGSGRRQALNPCRERAA